MSPDDFDLGRYEYVGGPWDGLTYEDDTNMGKVARSFLRLPDGTRWGKVRYEKDPLTGSYLFVERIGE